MSNMRFHVYPSILPLRPKSIVLKLSCKYLFTALLVGSLLACAGVPTIEPVEHLPTTGSITLARTDGRPLIAYALGSGAVRGFAHVGVLNALQRAGIVPDLIVGTSSGGLVGALYAAGIRGDELTQVALNVERDQVIDYTTSRRGFVTGDSLQAFVNESLDFRQLHELDIPLAVVSTELRSGGKTVFTHGNSGLAVRAASSFPGLFKPVTIGDHEYVDGGVVSPVPVDAALDLGADIVIAVDVAKAPSRDAVINGWIDVLHQSYLIMARALSRTEIEKADVVIRPDIGDMSLLDFEQRQTAIDAGEAAARLAIPEILKAVERKTQ